MGAAIVEATNDLETELHDNKEELIAKLKEFLHKKSDLFNYKNPEEDNILGRAFGHVHSPYRGEEWKKEALQFEIVSEKMECLRSLNLSDDDLGKLLKKFFKVDALSGKTVLLVTYQVNFLLVFHYVMWTSNMGIIQATPYLQLLASSPKCENLVNAHKETVGSERLAEVTPEKFENSITEINKTYVEKQFKTPSGDQLIKQES